MVQSLLSLGCLYQLCYDEINDRKEVTALLVSLLTMSFGRHMHALALKNVIHLSVKVVYKNMVIHDIECPYRDQMSLNNTNQTKLYFGWTLCLTVPHSNLN